MGSDRIARRAIPPVQYALRPQAGRGRRADGGRSHSRSQRTDHANVPRQRKPLWTADAAAAGKNHYAADYRHTLERSSSQHGSFERRDWSSWVRPEKPAAGITKKRI